MDTLRKRVEALEHHLQTLEAHTQTVERRLRWWRRLAWGLLVLSLVSLGRSSSTAQEESTSEGSRRLVQRLADFEHTLGIFQETFKHFAMRADEEGRPEVVIHGANLRIVNGLGQTACTDEQDTPLPNCPNGLGNLIVGYNERRGEGDDNRTGSHNVVVGRRHNFSTFGGLVVGQLNEISGAWASVSGGSSNTARGFAAAVSGGERNTASNAFASVSGGLYNVASEVYASVSGGERNTANGFTASVSGGSQNTANGFVTSVSGGDGNTASGLVAAVSGGHGNRASGDFSSVCGGDGNTASGNYAVVSGGRNRTAPGDFDWVAGPLFADEQDPARTMLPRQSRLR